VDAALGHPDRLDLVDIGAGRGELLTALVEMAEPDLSRRLRPVAIEVAPRPAGLAERIGWRPDLPDRIVGLLVATEWLDNVPLDIAGRDTRDLLAVEFGPADGAAATGWRYLHVDAEGRESTGDPLTGADERWRARWWPDGTRVELGRPRDEAWADAVGHVEAGLALAVDYGHLRDARPPLGTLTGFRGGREVPPVPDGSCDLTAHIAADSVAAAGSAVAGLPSRLVRQTDALRDLGVSGRRPPIELARTDPAGYLRALASASTAAELTEPAGLGGHLWLFQPVALPAFRMSR